MRSSRSRREKGRTLCGRKISSVCSRRTEIRCVADMSRVWRSVLIVDCHCLVAPGAILHWAIVRRRPARPEGA
jgi:hypothetical protein